MFCSQDRIWVKEILQGHQTGIRAIYTCAHCPCYMNLSVDRQALSRGGFLKISLRRPKSTYRSDVGRLAPA